MISLKAAGAVLLVGVLLLKLKYAVDLIKK
jgi:hypothetical protein